MPKKADRKKRKARAAKVDSAVTERRALVYQYRMQELSYSEIAKALAEEHGIRVSIPTIHKDWHAAFAERTAEVNELAAQAREVHARKLEQLWRIAFAKAAYPGEFDDPLKAIGQCVTISKRYCALMGLDAPVKSEVQVEGGVAEAMAAFASQFGGVGGKKA